MENNGGRVDDGDWLRRAAERVVPPGVAVAALPVGCDHDYPLYAEEQACIVTAKSCRRAEFAAGRNAARTVLKRLGVLPGPLPADADGAVTWPAGVAGSVSHTKSWAVAGVTSELRGIGIDLEVISRMSPGVARRILRDEERSAICTAAGFQQEQATIYFCVKEAIYKALHPVLRTFIGFEQACLIPTGCDDGVFSFSVEMHHSSAAVNVWSANLQAQALIVEGHALACVWLLPHRHQ